MRKGEARPDVAKADVAAYHIDIDQAAITATISPDTGVNVSGRGFITVIVQETFAIAFAAKVADFQGQKLFAAITVLRYGRIVHFEDMQAGRVVYPHRHRAGIEQCAVFAFALGKQAAEAVAFDRIAQASSQ